MLNERVKLAEQGEYYKSQNMLWKADSAYLNSPNITTTIGSNIQEMIKGDSALYYYKRAIQLDSNYTPAYINYGHLLNITNRSYETIQILQLGLSNKSTFPYTRQILCYTLACS